MIEKTESWKKNSESKTDFCLFLCGLTIFVETLLSR